LKVCSASSLDGSIISASGALISLLIAPLLTAPLLFCDIITFSFCACAIPT